MKRASLFMALPAAALLACDGLGTDVPPTGILVADLRGAVVEHYEGDSGFRLGEFEDGRPKFSLRSEKTSGQGRLSFMGESAGVPGRGEYEFVAQPAGGYPDDGYVAHYTWGNASEATAVGDTVGEWYTARSGTLRIISSAEDRVEGEFHLLASRYCVVVKTTGGTTTTASGGCQPWEVEPDAPEVEVTGTFVALPLPPAEAEQMPLPEEDA